MEKIGRLSHFSEGMLALKTHAQQRYSEDSTAVWMHDSPELFIANLHAGPYIHHLNKSREFKLENVTRQLENPNNVDKKTEEIVDSINRGEYKHWSNLISPVSSNQFSKLWTTLPEAAASGYTLMTVHSDPEHPNNPRLNPPV